MIDLNHAAKLGYETTLKRGRIRENMTHKEICDGILSEFMEFCMASSTKPSEHLPEYPEDVEELADLILCCLTELQRKGMDAEEVIMNKLMYNMYRE